MIKEAIVYASRLTGDFYQRRADVTERPAPLGEGEAVFVKIINPQYLPDGITPNDKFIFYGDADVQEDALFPATDTGLLPVNRVDKFWVRTKTGESVRITYEVYR
jgi:hypothetical protein